MKKIKFLLLFVLAIVLCGCEETTTILSTQEPYEVVLKEGKDWHIKNTEGVTVKNTKPLTYEIVGTQEGEAIVEFSYYEGENYEILTYQVFIDENLNIKDVVFTSSENTFEVLE